MQGGRASFYDECVFEEYDERFVDVAPAFFRRALWLLLPLGSSGLLPLHLGLFAS